MGTSAVSRRVPAGSRKSTREQILDVAERLVQTRGFNGFSYADVSTELAITKASLHYHFPGKADLGLALIERYTAVFAQALADIEATGTSTASRFERYVALYVDVLKDGRLCLCGMLAAEFQTLPEPMQAALRRFFDLNDSWLAKHFEAGRRDGHLRFDGAARDVARMVSSALEGAMLLARPFGDSSRFTAAAERLFDQLAGTTATRRSPVADRKSTRLNSSHT